MGLPSQNYRLYNILGELLQPAHSPSEEKGTFPSRFTEVSVLLSAVFIHSFRLMDSKGLIVWLLFSPALHLR